MPDRVLHTKPRVPGDSPQIFYSFLVVFVFLTLGFRSVKRVARVVVAFLYRNLLGYLLYPVRVIASTGLIILFFGFFFTAINYLDTEFRFGNIVPTYENSVTPSPDPVRRSSIASCVYEFPRMVYFSCVTFTTLGYGDERPTGIARPFANLTRNRGQSPRDGVADCLLCFRR